VLAREMHRREDHPDQPIGVLAIVCRVTPIVPVPLVRSRRRQLLKISKPRPDAKGRAYHPLYRPVPRLQTTAQALTCRMLPNHEYAIPQREPLIRIIRNSCIHRSMSNRNACRRCNHPPHMLIRPVPHLDPKGQVAGNVVQVWIGQLPQ
jgi:hypothetical protein